ncbi:MAG TPA: LEA type 2 family protein [Methanoregulaceae archaeon]|nr:LEA type 2 family protein [Methanoregulaceae archaeon]
MPRHLVSVLVLAAVLMIVGTAGCIAQPTVAVEGVRVGTFTPANTTLQVEVQVTNPNSFDIPLKDVAFTVSSVEGNETRRLGEGETGPFTLPARQTITRNVPVTLDNQALLNAALATVRAGRDRITLRVGGTVSGDLYGIVTVNVPFEQDQTVMLQELLGMAGMQVSEAQIRQALGAAQAVSSGGIPGVTIRVG